MMKIDKNKLIPKLIIIIPLLLVLFVSLFISTFYIDKVTTYFAQAKERSILEHIKTKKSESEVWVNQLKVYLDYKNNKIEDVIKKELKIRLDTAYRSALYIHNKYKNKKSKKDIQQHILDSLSQMKFNDNTNYIFIRSFSGKSILSSMRSFKKADLLEYTDADGRAIILEEITKVRKRKEGYIRTRFSEGSGVQLEMVKDLELYGWYIGTSIYETQQTEKDKHKVLEMIKSIPMESSDFMAIYDAKKSIYLSPKMRDVLGGESLDIISKSLTKDDNWYKNKVDGYFYYSKYFEPFDWHVVYGFNTFDMSNKELQKQRDFGIVLDQELKFILIGSLLIILLVAGISVILSRSVNEIFKRYQDDVLLRENEMKLLNASLEQRVKKELANLRKKDRMLIQQSKMADMGDMLSMIAHQWRQPLNQLSYVLMNIDSAHEHKELTSKYLEKKIKEGNELLEFMSQTIDDFRDYFKPEQKKEIVNVGAVIERGLELMRKPLESSQITIEHKSDCNAQSELFTTEFVQVLLNLVKNARDVLLDRAIKEPKIEIITRCLNNKVIVEIKDNGGGIDSKIIDKIFEPYFTTKDEHNGTGLGLYMSKMIVEEHIGGILSVTNTNEGASFSITL